MADGIDNCAEGPVDVTIEYPTEIIPEEKKEVCFDYSRWKKRMTDYARMTTERNWRKSRWETIKQMTGQDVEDDLCQDNVQEDADHFEEEGVAEDEKDLEEHEEELEEHEDHVEESRSNENE